MKVVGKVRSCRDLLLHEFALSLTHTHTDRDAFHNLVRSQLVRMMPPDIRQKTSFRRCNGLYVRHLIFLPKRAIGSNSFILAEVKGAWGGSTGVGAKTASSNGLFVSVRANVFLLNWVALHRYPGA